MSGSFEFGAGELARFEELDRRFTEEGVRPHARGFRVVQQFCRERNIFFSIPANPLVDELDKIYKTYFSAPKVAGSGFYGGMSFFLDHVYRVEIPMVLGQVSLSLKDLANLTDHQLSRIQRDSSAMEKFSDSAFDAVDIGAAALQFNGFEIAGDREKELLLKAAYQNQATTAILTGAYLSDAIVQTSVVAFELALKSVMVNSGATEQDLRRVNHNLDVGIDFLAERGIGNFETYKELRSAMPAMVKDRYTITERSLSEKIEIARCSQAAVSLAVRHLTGATLRPEYKPH